MLPDVGAAFRMALGLASASLFFGFAGRFVWRLYTDKVLDFGEAAAATLVVIAYLAQVIARWNTVWGPLLLLTAFALVPIGYYGHRWVAARATTAMMVEDAVKWESTRLRDPRNAAAHLFLGEVYLEAGAFRAALEALGEAVALAPRDRKARALYRRAFERVEEQAAKMTRCPRCSAPIEPHAKICPGCVRLQAEHAMEAAPPPKPYPRWLSFALAGGLLASSTASVTGLLPAWLAALISLALLAGTAAYVLRIARH